jgi:hypothetical protein
MLIIITPYNKNVRLLTDRKKLNLTIIVYMLTLSG